MIYRYLRCTAEELHVSFAEILEEPLNSDALVGGVLVDECQCATLILGVCSIARLSSTGNDAGNVLGINLTDNACLAKVLPGESVLCSEVTVVQGCLMMASMRSVITPCSPATRWMWCRVKLRSNCQDSPLPRLKGRVFPGA